MGDGRDDPRIPARRQIRSLPHHPSPITHHPSTIRAAPQPPRASRTAARTRGTVSASGSGRVAPAAALWPPPPNWPASRAQSRPFRDRTLSLIPPRACSMNSRPTSTPLEAHGVVDQVLGVLRDRAGPLEVVAGDGGVGDPAAEVGLQARPASRPSAGAGPGCSARRGAGRSRRSRRPTSTSSAAVRSVSGRVLGWRNQPVSIAIAVSRPVAISGVNVAAQGAGRPGRPACRSPRPRCP